MAFHQSLHCFQGKKKSSEKEIQFSLETIAYDPSLYSMDHSMFILSNQKEKSIGA